MLVEGRCHASVVGIGTRGARKKVGRWWLSRCRGEAPCSLQRSSGQREGSQDAAVLLTKAISEVLDDFNSFESMRADEAEPGRAAQNVRLAAFLGKAASCQAPSGPPRCRKPVKLCQMCCRGARLAGGGRRWGQNQLIWVKRKPTGSMSQPHRPAAAPWLALMGQEVAVPGPGRLPWHTTSHAPQRFVGV